MTWLQWKPGVGDVRRWWIQEVGTGEGEMPKSSWTKGLVPDSGV